MCARSALGRLRGLRPSLMAGRARSRFLLGPWMGIGVLAALLAAILLTACGGSGSSTSYTVSAAELQAAKKAGEEKAREQDRVKNLQKQVRALKHRVNHG